MKRAMSVAVCVLVMGGVAGAMPSVGAAQSIWPEHPENRKVLPEDITPDQLRDVMRGFSLALGVRCSHCHVGEEGAPLTTYDFASDEKPNKERARTMYRMLGMINDELKNVEPSGPERVNMWCTTCHNGRARPQTLSEAVLETYRAEGADAAMAHFEALRERYYGAAGYDFTPPSVNALGSQLFQQGDTATALRFFERNVEDYPDFAEGWESLGDVWAARGDKEQARGFYERALELAPNNGRIRRSLQAVR